MAEGVDKSPEMINKCLKACRVISQMMAARQYESLDDDEIFSVITDEMEIDEFEATYDSIKNTHYFRNNTTTEALAIVFDFRDKLTHKTFKEDYFKYYTNADKPITHLILVHQEGSLAHIFDRIKKQLRLIGKKLETFTLQELQYNITMHFFVPKHKVLSNEEKNELFNRYKIDETKLPQILSTDPVVRYYGADPGTIIEITRRSETCGRVVTYRLVI